MKSIFTISLLLIVAVLLIASTLTEAKFCGFPFQNLPRWTNPIVYHLDLTPNLLDNSFQGLVDIVTQGFGPKQFRRNIILHAGVNLNINSVELFLNLRDKPDEPSPIRIEKICHDELYEILVIEIHESELDKVTRLPSTLTARIKFDGHLRINGHGLVSLAQIKQNEHEAGVEQDAHQQVYMYTRFGRYGAHFLFPCFDEARFKATFSLRLRGIPLDMDALSNSEPQRIDHDLENNLKIFQYWPTLQMSVESFGFVLGKFSQTKVVEFVNDQLTIELYNDPDITEISNLTRTILMRSYDLLTNYFSVKHPMTALKFVGIKGIGDTFSSNMAGLIVVDSQSLNYHQDLTETSTKLDASAASFAAGLVEMMARQWIGHMVSLEFDEESWLFEGLIGLIGLQLTDKILPQLNYRLLFARKVIAPALEQEATPSADAPLSNYQLRQMKKSLAISPPERSAAVDTGEKMLFGPSSDVVRGEFNLSNRQKLKAITIMMHVEQACGPVNHPKAIQKIIRIYSRKVVHLNDFMLAITQQCHFKPDKMIRLLREQPGYPLIKARLSPTNLLFISQERFNNDYSRELSIAGQRNLLWVVPIGYEYGNLPENWNRVLSTVLYKMGQETTVSFPPNYQVTRPGNWVKVNNLSRGFYRVLYSDQMLEMLRQAAYANALSEIECFNLIDDARAIFRSGKRGAYYLITILVGLSNNQSEMIQEEVLHGYKELKQLYQPTNIARVDDWIAQIGRVILVPHFLKQGFSLEGLETRSGQESRAEAFTLLALLDYEPLYSKALELYKSSELSELDDRLHDAIFISIARHGSDEDFLELLALLKSQEYTRSEELDRKLMIAFAHSSTPERLKQAWSHIKTMNNPEMITLFIKKLMETSDGSTFATVEVLPRLAGMFSHLGSDRVLDVLQLMCMSDSCGPMTDLLRLLGHDRWMQLIEIVSEKRRRNYFLQQVDLNKLVL